MCWKMHKLKEIFEYKLKPRSDRLTIKHNTPTFCLCAFNKVSVAAGQAALAPRIDKIPGQIVCFYRARRKASVLLWVNFDK